jgi:L-threonylcarbamoyladenylate synthase
MARKLVRIKVDRCSLSPLVIAQAVEVMRRGGIVAAPTDTVYGLIAPATASGWRRLRDAKMRSPEKPFLVALLDVPTEGGWVRPVSRLIRRRIASLWPQPVTLLLPAGPAVPSPLVGPHGKVGLRRAADPLTQALAAAAGGAVISTSANLACHPGARDAAEIAVSLGAVLDLLLDGGTLHSCARPTTIVDVTLSPPRILRHGACPAERVGALLGEHLATP